MHHNSIALRKRRVNWRRLVSHGLCIAANARVQKKPQHAHLCTRDAGLPQPKFKIGQHICHEWTCDDQLDPNYGRTYRDYGYIVGMFYGIKNFYLPGWVYQISFYRMESSDRFELPYLDEVEEDQLRTV